MHFPSQLVTGLEWILDPEEPIANVRNPEGRRVGPSVIYIH
jgi:hypothetical protein